MKPEDFRKILIELGTLVGLLGDYGGVASEWSHGKLIRGRLTFYIVVERIHNVLKDVGESEWDTAAVVSLDTPLKTTGYTINGNAKEAYFGSRFVLVQRAPPEYGWDYDDLGVHVYGVHEGEPLEQGPLARSDWAPKVVWLSDGALMTIEEPSRLSRCAKLLRQREAKDRELDSLEE